MSKKPERQGNISKTYIGIDYGESSIGIALGRNGAVLPLKIIDGRNQNSAISELTRILLDNTAHAFILGLPLASDGKETAQSLKTRRFAKLLKITSKKPVIFVNEEGTTAEATEQLLIENSVRRKRRFSDDVAAAIILKRYFQES